MNKPNMITVASSNIAKLGYDDKVQVVWITFVSGATYIYHEVPQSEFENLRANNINISSTKPAVGFNKIIENPKSLFKNKTNNSAHGEGAQGQAEFNIDNDIEFGMQQNHLTSNCYRISIRGIFFP